MKISTIQKIYAKNFLKTQIPTCLTLKLKIEANVCQNFFHNFPQNLEDVKNLCWQKDVVG